MTTQEHVWFYLRDSFTGEVDEGPISEKQLIELTRSGKIKLKTKLRSPTRTRNRLVYAESIPAIASIIKDRLKSRDLPRKAQPEADIVKAENADVSKHAQPEPGVMPTERALLPHQPQFTKTRNTLECKHCGGTMQKKTIGAMSGCASTLFVIGGVLFTITCVGAIIGVPLMILGSMESNKASKAWVCEDCGAKIEIAQ